ncbi:MAG: AarF/ABC1/UbiB kinase family protein [Thermoanaerobaculia bacterium]|nr:AarF/ABC1/UbiB kinase family protein [Thermoanaerobaculia bacterium]
MLLYPLVKRSLVRRPFPEQLRRRLEILGPTYIKLGQVLSLREDVLPRAVTAELKNLLDRLPAVPFPRFLELVVDGLGRPLDSMFSWIDPAPLGSASIAQIHRATTLEGDPVILKVVKPGIERTLERDAVLLNVFAAGLQLVFSRYQPRRVIREIMEYTLREVDLKREADNAEIFAANFKDFSDVVFPRIYRAYSSRTVLCMEFLDGLRPDTEAAQQLDEPEREHIIDVGARAIIQMLYSDGFFHADLHPGNLLILPGARAGFIDLGMVGRLDEQMRRSLLYYYYCLVTGDPESAARYLANVAEPAPGGDPDGFRREVADIGRRWHCSATFSEFSLAQLILESVTLGAEFRMYFPVELVLMVKALVTFEGVGHMMKPGFDVAAVSRRHVHRIFLHQFSPMRIFHETLRNAPELVDAVVKAPLLISEGLRLLEHTTRRPARNPFAGLRGTIFGGFCLVAGSILAAAELLVPLLTRDLGEAPAAVVPLWPVWGLLLLVGVLAALNKSE